MDRYCHNCGAKLAEGDLVCGNCGTRVPEAAQQAAGAAQVSTPVEAVATESPAEKTVEVKPAKEASAPAPEDKTKKFIKLAIAAVAAVVVLVLAISIVSANTGYKGVMKKYAKVLRTSDAHKMVELLSDEMLAYYAANNIDEDDLEEKFEDTFEDMMDAFEDKVDKVKSFDITIKKVDEVKDKKVKRAKEYFSDRYEIETDSVKKIYKVTFNFEVKGSKKGKVVKKSDYINDTVYIIKEKGGCKLFLDVNMMEYALKYDAD